MRPKPGDLITFSGLIGEDRGPCLVIAVHPVPGEKSNDIGVRVLFLTPRCVLITRELIDGGVMAQGVERVNDDDC